LISDRHAASLSAWVPTATKPLLVVAIELITAAPLTGKVVNNCQPVPAAGRDWLTVWPGATSDEPGDWVELLVVHALTARTAASAIKNRAVTLGER
jgi:hypothetical protein